MIVYDWWYTIRTFQVDTTMLGLTMQMGKPAPSSCTNCSAMAYANKISILKGLVIKSLYFCECVSVRSVSQDLLCDIRTVKGWWRKSFQEGEGPANISSLYHVRKEVKWEHFLQHLKAKTHTFLEEPGQDRWPRLCGFWGVKFITKATQERKERQRELLSWPSWLPYSTNVYLVFHLFICCSMTKLKLSREICQSRPVTVGVRSGDVNKSLQASHPTSEI